MERSYIVEKVNAMINEKNYNRNFAPFIMHYFLMICEKEGLNEEELGNKLGRYKDRIDRIQYIYLGEERIKVDSNKKVIYVDEKIKKDTREKTLEEYIYRAYSEQDIITENTNINVYTRNSRYVFGTFRYKAKNSDTEYINNMLSCMFDLPREQLVNLEEYFDGELEKVDRDRMPRYYDYLHDSKIHILRSLDDKIQDIFRAKDDKTKKDSYISIYALGLFAIRFRIDCENNNMPKLKSQFEELKRVFKELKLKFNITEEELFEHKIRPSWKVTVQNNENEISKGLEKTDAQVEKDKEEDIQVDTEDIKRDLKEIYISRRNSNGYRNRHGRSREANTEKRLSCEVFFINKRIF